jgi:hypothetical protein
VVVPVVTQSVGVSVTVGRGSTSSEVTVTYTRVGEATVEVMMVVNGHDEDSAAMAEATRPARVTADLIIF